MQTSVFNCAKFVLIFSACVCLSSGTSLPVFAQSDSQAVTIEGKVCSADGTPLAGAHVELRADEKTTVAETKTDGAGFYSFKGQKGTHYQVRAAMEAYEPRVIEVATLDGDERRFDFFLGSSRSKGVPDFQFADEPNFAVAGVTDWSNVGLHGSDVNVKTSEALTKETAALKPSTAHLRPTNKDAEAHRLLGDEKEKNGDPVAAEREYAIAVKLEPSEENYFAWGAELLLHRAGVAAVEVLSKGVASYPRSQRMIEALSAAFYANGQYAEAAQQMCRAADLLPASVEPYLFLGRIEEAASDIFPCGEEKLRHFAMTQAGNPQANFYYGLVLLKKARQSQRDEEFAEAEKFFRQSLAADPSYGEAHLQLGMMYNARDKKDAALREFEEAVRAAPALTAAHYQLSLAYRRSGESVKADEEMKKYEELRRSEEAALEKKRKEMKQFVTILQQSSPK